MNRHLYDPDEWDDRDRWPEPDDEEPEENIPDAICDADPG